MWRNGSVTLLLFTSSIRSFHSWQGRWNALPSILSNALWRQFLHWQKLGWKQRDLNSEASQDRRWHFQTPLEIRRKKQFVVANLVDEGNTNHTVDWLRSSNWIVECYHQYRHDDRNAGWFPLFNVEFGVLDIVIVLELFLPSCAPFNTYTCGNNLPAIDESVKCTSAWIFRNHRFWLRWKIDLVYNLCQSRTFWLAMLPIQSTLSNAAQLMCSPDHAWDLIAAASL